MADERKKKIENQTKRRKRKTKKNQKNKNQTKIKKQKKHVTKLAYLNQFESMTTCPGFLLLSDALLFSS